jgi:hypothetical protein
MHVAFSYVRCPSCGSTFQPDATVAPPENGISKTCSQTDQGQRGAMFAPRFVLHSWKEIAAYLGLSVRTAQRWGHDLRLPVHRPNHRDRRGAVFAFSEEIDGWLHSTPVGLPRKPTVPCGERTVQARTLKGQCAKMRRVAR